MTDVCTACFAAFVLLFAFIHDDTLARRALFCVHPNCTYKGWDSSLGGIIVTLGYQGVPWEDRYLLLQDSSLLVVKVISTVCKMVSVSISIYHFKSLFTEQAYSRY